MTRLLLALTLGAASVAAAPAPGDARDDLAINHIYETVAAAVAANSGETIAGAFADDAVVMDPRPSPPAAGEAFRATVVAMAARLKAEGVGVSAQYRIERRIRSGELAIDTGYRRQAMTRPGAAEPMVQYNKFLVVARRQRDGRWKILRDASLPASKEAWDGAVRAPGLKFDE